MPARYDTVSFLSDYGLDDEFVGVVKAVIRGIAPHVTVIDISHGVPPHDVRAGGLALARSVQYLPPGVVLAVVDPGVGGGRRPLALRDAEGRLYVGPDNGLLVPAAERLGGIDGAWELQNPAYRLEPVSRTFHGRDLFAPAAAHLASGVDPAELGPALDPASLVRLEVPEPVARDGFIRAHVVIVDRFGNVQLNVDPDELAAMGERISLRYGDQVRTAVRVHNYAELGPGQIGLVVDSYGLVAVCLDKRSAADELHLHPPAEVTLEPAAER